MEQLDDYILAAGVDDEKQKKAILLSIGASKIHHDLKTTVPNFSGDNTTYKHCIDKLHSMYEH